MAERRAGRPSVALVVCRVLVALPAMTGSLLVLVVVFGWLGEWEGVVLGVWFAVAAGLATRPGERLAVRAVFGFRQPSRNLDAEIAPSRIAALCAVRLRGDQVDVYVCRADRAAVRVIGRRSVAISGAATDPSSRGAELQQVLLDAFARIAVGGTGAVLVTGWLAAPWRLVSRGPLALARQIARRQPRILLGCVIAAAVVIEVATEVRRGSWPTGVFVASVATAAAGVHVVDGWIGRRTQRAVAELAAAGRRSSATRSAHHSMLTY